MISKAALWAKLKRDPAGRITHWHSLVEHSADVAAVLLALIAQPTIAARLARLAGRDALDVVTVARLGALAFLHDIGKANRGFRARVDPRAALVGHIDQLAWLFTEAGAKLRERLDAVLGLDRLDDWLGEDWTLFEAVFAHHGRPWRPDAARNETAHWAPGPDGDPIADLAPMRDALDRWFPLAFQPGPPLPSAPGFHHAFAGLLMLADWLGSDTRFFPLANGSGPDRMAEAQRRARDAVQMVGLHSAPAATRARIAAVSFATAFAVTPPRPVQEVATLPQARCVVLEAETGAGKTEAALWRFKHLLGQGAVDGLYFALPTRVAATAMFARVKMFRDRVFGGPSPAVVLAVPGQVAVDEAEGHPLPDFGFEWDDAPDHGAAQARWAAEHPKRFLAASIAVGTVDQALLSAIRVRHAQMRGAALSRHLLVVDEIHASDRYMQALLGTLLANHTGAGGHALLLSATLGGAARARLLQTPCPDPARAEDVPYPVLSWAEGGTERRHEPPQPSAGLPVSAKHVEVEMAPLLDRPEAIARTALAAAASGAAVLVIRNTVAAAVATARALEVLAGMDDPRLLRLGGVATLHHGRFARSDRRALDGAVETALGRNRLAGGRIVTGTQTLEISLDLDADLLLTDLCPADVLLQRLGRLHRHPGRARPPGFAVPRAVVLVPGARDLLPFANRSGGRHGLGRVYDDLRVIEATWREIEVGVPWCIPEMNRRLVERTTHPAHLERIAAELAARDAAAWTRHVQDNEGKIAAALNEAATAMLDWRCPFDTFRLDSDERIATRLGAKDRQVDLPADLPGPFGSKVAGLRIPSFLLEGVPEEADPEAARRDGDTIRFRLGAQGFRYDRFGLERERH